MLSDVQLLENFFVLVERRPSCVKLSQRLVGVCLEVCVIDEI